jgi:uncharacterized protein (TIGR02996 family)
MARTRATQEPEPPPGPPMTAAERAELDDRLARLLTKPLRSDIGNRQFLLWSARDDSSQSQMMVWTPETDAEIRGAGLFYDAAHGLGAFAKPVQTGRPVRRTAEHRAFIAGILADRADATGYLAYADYLTERGDPQGDYVRACVELSKLPPDHPDAEALNGRLNELSAAHAEEWYAPLGELGLRPEFYGTFTPWAWMSLDRGVIEEVAIDRPGVLPQNAARLFAAAPFLRKLRFEQGHLDPAALAKVKQLTQIEELDLHRTELTAEGLRALLRSRYLTGLKTLGIGGNTVGHAGVHELTAWAGLTRLDTLDLAACNVGPEAVAELVGSANVANLKCLRVGGNALDTVAVGAVVGSPHLRSLTELDLGGAAGLEADTMRRLPSAVFAKSLQNLNLDSATFQPGAFEAFMRCKLPALQTLKLNSVALRVPGAAALARAAFAGTLAELYLDLCSLRAAGVEALAGGTFPKLTTLDLSRNNLGNRGGVALADAAGSFPALTSLRLWSDNLGPEAVARLARSELLANLTSLDLSDNRIGPAGAAALANSLYLQRISSLVVDEKAVGKKGKQALLDRFGEGVVSFR